MNEIAIKKKIIIMFSASTAIGIVFCLVYRFANIGLQMLMSLFRQQDSAIRFSDMFYGMFKDKWVPIVFLAGFLFGIFIFATKTIIRKIQGYYDEERNFSYSKKGTFGTSTFMTNEEFDKKLQSTALSETNEIIFGTLEK